LFSATIPGSIGTNQLAAVLIENEQEKPLPAGLKSRMFR
jgi:hypothetical protein